MATNYTASEMQQFLATIAKYWGAVFSAALLYCTATLRQVRKCTPTVDHKLEAAQQPGKGGHERNTRLSSHSIRVPSACGKLFAIYGKISRRIVNIE